MQMETGIKTATGDMGKKLTAPERDKILMQVAALYPGPKNTNKRAEVMNNAGVQCGRSKAPWTAKNFNDNLRHAKKRMG